MGFVAALNPAFSIPLLDPAEPVPLQRNKRILVPNLQASLFTSGDVPLRIGTTPPGTGALRIDGTGFGGVAAEFTGTVLINGNPVGSVSSVGLTMPPEFIVGNSPITSAGDIAVTWDDQPESWFLAGPPPLGGAGTPAFRAIDPDDIPTLNQNTTGTAANVTGVVAPANGGTGVSTAPDTFDILLGQADNTYALRELVAGTGITLTEAGTQLTIESGGGGGSNYATRSYARHSFK
jgi:hypothetical protein